MMLSNRGTTTLKGKRKSRHPMNDFDALPPELRKWVSEAMLPWSAHSVRKSFRKAIAKTGDPQRALEELDALQTTLIAKDSRRIWGAEYPAGPNPS